MIIHTTDRLEKSPYKNHPDATASPLLRKEGSLLLNLGRAFFTSAISAYSALKNFSGTRFRQQCTAQIFVWVSSCLRGEKILGTRSREHRRSSSARDQKLCPVRENVGALFGFSDERCESHKIDSFQPHFIHICGIQVGDCSDIKSFGLF